MLLLASISSFSYLCIFLLLQAFLPLSSTSLCIHFNWWSLSLVIVYFHGYVFFICYAPCFNICIKKIISFFLTWGVLCAILSSIRSGNPPSFLLITALETWLMYQWSNHTHFKMHFFFFFPIRYWEMVDCNFSKLQELVWACLLIE